MGMLDSAVNGMASRLMVAGFYPAEAFALAEACYINETKRTGVSSAAVLDRKQATAEVNGALNSLGSYPVGEDAHRRRIILWERVFGRGSWPEPIDPIEIYGPTSEVVPATEFLGRRSTSRPEQGRVLPHTPALRRTEYEVERGHAKEKVFLSIASAFVLAIITIGVAMIFISESDAPLAGVSDDSNYIDFVLEPDPDEACPNGINECWMWNIRPEESCSSATVNIELSNSVTGEAIEQASVRRQTLVAGEIATVILDSEYTTPEYAGIRSITCPAPY